MSFVVITYENNPKVDTHKFHTIQNKITTPCQAFKEGIKNQYCQYNRRNKVTTFNSKDLKFILHYITLTDYYI